MKFTPLSLILSTTTGYLKVSTPGLRDLAELDRGYQQLLLALMKTEARSDFRAAGSSRGDIK